MTVRKRASKGEPLRFVLEVALTHKGDECLIWPFGKNHKGHGSITLEGRPRLVSRIVCKLAHGEPPTAEHHAAHSCGNGHLSCVNPGHLSWKTPVENAADKVIHGTYRYGERHQSAKLTAADVERIRALKGKMTLREIGNQFGISQGHAGRILTGCSWSPKYLPTPPHTGKE